MSDIVITPGSVLPGSGYTPTTGLAGATITAGQAVYYDTATSTWKLAVANTTAIASGNGTFFGIALNGAAAGQPITVDTVDSAGITIGGTTVVGTIYCVSAAAAGGICPWADLATTNYVTVIGVGKTGNKIVTLSGGATGIAHA